VTKTAGEKRAGRRDKPVKGRGEGDDIWATSFKSIVYRRPGRSCRGEEPESRLYIEVGTSGLWVGVRGEERKHSKGNEWGVFFLS